jgi:O-antigen/teichoic acid export membrane protein
LNAESDRRRAPPGESTVARNTALALAAQVTTAVFTAGLTLYLVRALGPDDYGIFALALSVGILVLLPSDFGLSQSTARFVADHRTDLGRVADVFSDAMRLKLIAGLAFAGLLFALAGPIADAYDEPDLVWPLRGMALAMFLQGLMGFVTTSFIALRRLSLNLRVVASESAIEASASVALVVLGAGATGAAFGRAIGYGFGVAVALLMVHRLLGRRGLSAFGPARGHARRIARYASAMFVIDWAYTAMTQVDSLVIGAILGSTQVGIFQAPLRLVTPILYPGLALAQGVAPRMSRGSGEPDVAGLGRAVRYLIFLQAAIVGPILVFAGPLSNRVLGAGYGESAEVLRALAPFIFVSGFAPLLSLSVNYLGEARRRVPIAVASVLLNLGLSILLVNEIGVVGAAISATAAISFYTAAHLWICWRLIELPLRPMLSAVWRAVLAAAPMAAILLAVGSDPSIIAMIVATILAWAAFLGAVIALRGFTADELRRGRAIVRRLLPGR